MGELSSKIKFELYNPAGLLLMDITGLATSRQFNKTRNDADEIMFNIDLREFERLAQSMNEDPATLLIANNTEVRVSSRGVYIGGGQIVQPTGILEPTREELEVRAYGFLNLLSMRYSGYDEVYTNVEITSIPQTQLANTQSLTNGNLGITIGHVDTVGPITWEFRQQDLKSSWQDLASLQAGGFDMEITADKKLNLYVLQGSYRNDIQLEYGANVKQAKIEVDGTQSANEIIALGAGIGAEATVTLQGQPGVTQLPEWIGTDGTPNPTGTYSLDSVPAQLNTTLLQNVVTFNGIGEIGGSPNLLKMTQATLLATAFPVITIQVVVELNGPYISDISIGDYIWVNMSKHPYYRGINGYYRLQRYEASIDDEDNVYATLYLTV